MKKESQQAAREVTSTLAPLSRRRFLTSALWATAGVSAIVAGGFTLMRHSPRDAEPVPAGLVHLDPSHYRLFQHLASVLLPTAGTTLAPAELIPVAHNVDAILGALDADIRKQLAMGFGLFDNAAVFTHGKRFVDLPAAEAQVYVNDWVNADGLARRSIGLVVSKLAHTGYWMDARTWPPIEFDGPVSRKWGIASLGNQPLPV